MRARFRNVVRETSGASAVEFALVAPLFLLMLLGIAEFSRLFWTTYGLQETAISTARCMGVPQTECQKNGAYDAATANAFARSKAAGWFIELDPSTIVVNRNASCQGLSGLSSVNISYNFTTVVPRLLTALAGGTQLSANACFTNY